uniref:Odorant receptor n=1 Tax=Rhyacophila nubila TaxID=1876001 RepID=A0A3G2KX43_9NEOP|nr:odorant receptor OR6 [Rhyacophila nubila]
MVKIESRRKGRTTKSERKRLFEFQKKLTKYVGIGMFKITENGDYDNFPHRRYRIYSLAIVTLILFLFIALEVVELFRDASDFERLTFQMSLIPSQILNIIKTLSMMYYHKKITNLITILEKSATDIYVSSFHIIKTDKNCLFLSKLYTVILVMCVLYFATPSLQTIYSKNTYFYDNKTITSVLIKNRLPVSTYSPFKINDEFTFCIMLFYQMFTLIYQSFIVCTNDCFAASILMHISCQFITVQLMMKNIHRNAIYYLRSKRLEKNSYEHTDRSGRMKLNYFDFDKTKFAFYVSNITDEKLLEECRFIINNRNTSFSEFSSDEISESMEIFLIDAVKLLEMTIECMKEFEYIFRHGFFGQIITSVIVICLSFYPLVGMKDADCIKLVGGSLMMMVFMPQLALVTWNCTNITIEAEKVATAAFCCPWYEANAKFRKTLTIAVSSAQRPQIIKACSGLIPLSNETFIDLVTRSYSAFAIVMSFKKQL